jgi:hypothetical protein
MPAEAAARSPPRSLARQPPGGAAQSCRRSGEGVAAPVAAAWWIGEGTGTQGDHIRARADGACRARLLLHPFLAACSRHDQHSDAAWLTDKTCTRGMHAHCQVAALGSSSGGELPESADSDSAAEEVCSL